MTRSKSTVINQAVSGIDSRIKNVFNRDFFSIYEGIIEQIDVENGFLNVRIPLLDNTLYEECRIMSLCNNDSAAILPNFKINTHVIVGFTQFSLAYPIVLGQIAPSMTINTPYIPDTLVLKNGKCGVRITEDGIDLFNEDSAITIANAGIYITNLTASISVTSSEIKIDCPGMVSIKGPDGVNISGGNIVLDGDAITANGEDLTDDDVGVI